MADAPLDLAALSWMRRMLDDGGARKIRVEARISLIELASYVGVDAATIIRWENGDRVPRSQSARRYAAALRELQALAKAKL